MAQKRKNPEQEEFELEQAYMELTGYDVKHKKKKPGVLIGVVCLIIMLLAGCALSIPFLLDQIPTGPTEPRYASQSTETEPTAANPSENSETE